MKKLYNKIMTEDEKKMQERKISLMKSALILAVLWGVYVLELLIIIARNGR